MASRFFLAWHTNLKVFVTLGVQRQRLTIRGMLTRCSFTHSLIAVLRQSAFKVVFTMAFAFPFNARHLHLATDVIMIIFTTVIFHAAISGA